MSLWHKRALINGTIWAVVALGFILCAFAGDGPSGFVDDSPRRNLAGAFLATGIVGTLVVRYFTRERSSSTAVLIDERDRTIAGKASEGAFAITSIFVFLLCIGLHDHFEEVGSVPVGWLWLIAYSSWILAYLSQALFSLLLYSGFGSNAEG